MGPTRSSCGLLQRDLTSRQTHDGERNLIKQLDRALAWARRPNRRRTAGTCAAHSLRIGRGQELDVLRFAEGTADAPDAPCHRRRTLTIIHTSWPAAWVNSGRAFASGTCRPDGAPRTRTQMLALGKRFGQGLQMVNILRDLPEDLVLGPLLSAGRFVGRA